MQNAFTAGAKVRLKNTENARAGVIEKVADDFAHVRYEHKPGVNPHGYYPLAHLELLTPTPAPQPAKEPKPAIKPQAKVADILGNIPIQA